MADKFFGSFNDSHSTVDGLAKSGGLGFKDSHTYNCDKGCAVGLIVYGSGLLLLPSQEMLIYHTVGSGSHWTQLK